MFILISFLPIILSTYLILEGKDNRFKLFYIIIHYCIYVIKNVLFPFIKTWKIFFLQLFQ
jgi:hypothetical protein